MPEAVIVDAVRTPIGRAFKGSLASLRPDDTAAFTVDQLLERNPGLDPALVEEVITGCGFPQGKQAFNIGRIVALLSEKLPQTVNGVTVSRYCASGLDAIRYAANNVKAGQGDVYIAAGVEFVSQYNERNEVAGDADKSEFLQGKEPGQPDVYIAMGETAVNVANKYGVTREAMDEYAQRSQELAVQSQESGFFDREIVPVTLADGTVVSKDDGPRASSTLEKLASLPEAFGGGGVTAGNEPEYMGVAPIGAIKKALDRAGMTIADVDTVELNEAFAAQVIPIMDECGIPLENMNPHGGAIALGHPFGQTGVRMMTPLINGLESDDKTIGLETMCVAGGQGEAMIVERLS